MKAETWAPGKGDRRVPLADEWRARRRRGLGKLDVLSNCSRLKQMPTGEAEEESESSSLLCREEALESLEKQDACPGLRRSV